MDWPHQAESNYLFIDMFDAESMVLIKFWGKINVIYKIVVSLELEYSFDQPHQFLFKFIKNRLLDLSWWDKIQWSNRQLKILNISWDMRGFVNRFSCMIFYHSTYNISTNTSPILMRVGSLNSSHWALFNSLFIDYFISSIHRDNAYRM